MSLLLGLAVIAVVSCVFMIAAILLTRWLSPSSTAPAAPEQTNGTTPGTEIVAALAGALLQLASEQAAAQPQRRIAEVTQATAARQPSRWKILGLQSQTSRSPRDRGRAQL